MKSFLRAIFLTLAFVVILGGINNINNAEASFKKVTENTYTIYNNLQPTQEINTVTISNKAVPVTFNSFTYLQAGTKESGVGGIYHQSNGKRVVLELQDKGKFHVTGQNASGYDDDIILGMYVKGPQPNSPVTYYAFKDPLPKSATAALAAQTLDDAGNIAGISGPGFAQDFGFSVNNSDKGPTVNTSQEDHIKIVNEKETECNLIQSNLNNASTDAERLFLQTKLATCKSELSAATTKQTTEKKAEKKFNEEKIGVSGVGLPSCGKMFSEALVPGGNDGSQEIGNCAAAIANFFVEAFSFLLVLAAYTFDYMLQFTIVDFSSYACATCNNGQPGSLYGPISIVWTLIKNICNLIFIGTILYIAIKTIVDGNGFGDHKLLGKVIIMAFLINFSLLFTKLAIDASNIATLEIYRGITSSQKAEISGAVSVTGKAADLVGIKDNEGGSLAAAYLNNMLITKVYDGTDTSISWNTIITNGMLAIVFILVATFVFLAASLMFLMRFFKLILLMMTSPVAFVGSIFPNASSYASSWWKNLRENLLFAPVFMIMAYISLQMLAATKGILDGGDRVSLVITYAFTIISMGACLVGAKMAGGHAGSADWATKMGKSITGRLTAGTAGVLGRNTIGRFSNYAAKSSALTTLASKTGVSGIAGRSLQKLAGTGAKATYDARNTKTVGALGLGKAGGEGGYAGRQEEVAKFQEKQLKSITEGSREEKVRKGLYDYHKSQSDKVRDIDFIIKQNTDNKAKKTTELSTINSNIKAQVDEETRLDTEKKKIDNNKETAEGELKTTAKDTAEIIENKTGKFRATEISAAKAKVTAAESKLEAVRASEKSLDYDTKVKKVRSELKTFQDNKKEAEDAIKKAQKDIDDVTKLSPEDENKGETKTKQQKAADELKKANERLASAGYKDASEIEGLKNEVKDAEKARKELQEKYLKDLTAPGSLVKTYRGVIGENTANEEALVKFLKDNYKKDEDKMLEKLKKSLKDDEKKEEKKDDKK